MATIFFGGAKMGQKWMKADTQAGTDPHSHNNTQRGHTCRKSSGWKRWTCLAKTPCSRTTARRNLTPWNIGRGSARLWAGKQGTEGPFWASGTVGHVPYRPAWVSSERGGGIWTHRGEGPPVQKVFWRKEAQKSRFPHFV